MMKAIEISEFGDADVLQLTEQEKPVPTEDEVLIRVHAAGVNRPDLLQRLGKYPPPEGVTEIPGLEVAGEIVESRSPDWDPGDKVCALLAGGGYAEYVVAPAGQCLPLPNELSMTEGAGLPECVFTVWNNLFHIGKLQSGEAVLIHGGSSGIGTTAIQMAKASSATVYVTAGSDEKCQACRELGADEAINYKTHDFVSEIKDGVDLVLDMVGGDYLNRNIELLKPNGRHVSIAFLRGMTGEIDIRKIMHKRLSLTGSTLRARPVEEKATLAKEIRKHIWPKVKGGQIKPVIFRTFPLEQASEAHKALETGDHIGKIILEVE